MEYINVMVPIDLNGTMDKSLDAVEIKYETYPIPCNFSVTIAQDYPKDITIVELKFHYDGYPRIFVIGLANEMIAASVISAKTMVLHKFLDKFVDCWPDVHPEVLKVAEQRVADILDINLETTTFATGGNVNFTINKTMPPAYAEYYNHPSPFLPAKPASEDEIRVSNLSKKLPGVDSKVEYPCSCKDVLTEKGLPTINTLWIMVQHLNDRHVEWTRERIADWIDELHDTGQVNTEFQPWNENVETNEPVEMTVTNHNKTSSPGWYSVGWTNEFVVKNTKSKETKKIETFEDALEAKKNKIPSWAKFTKPKKGKK